MKRQNEIFRKQEIKLKKIREQSKLSNMLAKRSSDRLHNNLDPISMMKDSARSMLGIDGL